MCWTIPPAWANAAEKVEPAPSQLDGPIRDDEFRLVPDDQTMQIIDDAIPMLSSPHFGERENASSQLEAIGAVAFARLRDVYRATPDSEVRFRIEKIVQSAYVDYHVYERVGFLGISQDTQHTPTKDEDPRIPEGHVAIRIAKIIPNTGAERAGLETGDLIVAIDGEPIAGTGQKAVELFGAGIRRRGPGAQVTLSILRGDEGMEVMATLGQPDAALVRDRGLPVVKEMVNKAGSRFSIWWPKYFHPQAADGSP